MKVKEIGFVAIPVTDMERARKFYEGVLGLKESGRFMEGQVDRIRRRQGHARHRQHQRHLDAVRSRTGAALEMEDFDEAIAELKKANVKFAWDAFESPVCHMAIVQDPDGNKLMIHKLKSA